jgi:hypothetical protein
LPLLCRAQLVKRDEAGEQFLLSRFLILALVWAGRGAAGLADQPLGQVAPTVGAKLLTVEFANGGSGERLPREAALC